MAHRIYIYNIEYSSVEQFPYYLGEWNYEIPALLLPLFSCNLRSKGKLLYADRVEGIATLRRFYDLLGNTYNFTYKNAFIEPVNKMFEFLENLPYDTFMIDGWDVFNMNEEKHSTQAKNWGLSIKEQLKKFDKALYQANLNPLNDIVESFGYQSFLEILETDWINFGLGYWNEEAYKFGYAEVYQENGLEGLKNVKNQILTPAVYQEIFQFFDDIAVIKKNEKYGYISIKGQEIVPPIYKDAFDVFDIYDDNDLENNTFFDLKVGIITSENDAVGLLDVFNNKILIPTEYEELQHIAKTFFNAKKNNKYYLINHLNKQLIQLESNVPFEYDFSELFFIKVKGSSKRKFYTQKGICLGDYIEDTLKELPNEYYYAKPNKWQKKIEIIKPDGILLEGDVDQVIFDLGYNTFAFFKNSKWHLYNTKLHKISGGFIEISKVKIDYLPNYFTDLFILNTTLGIGLFDAANEIWLITPEKNIKKIDHLENQLLIVQLNIGMQYWDGKTNFLSDKYDYVSEPINRENHQLLLYKNNDLYELTYDNEIKLVNVNQLGVLNDKKYNLRNQDLNAFNQFFESWRMNNSSNYFHFFDNSSLYNYALDLLKENSLEEAIKVLEYGVTRKHPEMITELAIIYANSDDENNYNISRAIELYKKAAKLEEKYAWNNLGYHLQNGLGIEQNIEKAIEAYSKAGNLGNGLAWENLGDLYYYGELVDQDYELALDYFLKANKYYFNNDDKLAEIYFSKMEYKKVLQLLKKDHNESFSPIYYAIMYEFGLGSLKINLKKAISFYEKAMQLNNYPDAVKQLLFHYRQESEFANQEKFKEWLCYAEENGIEIDREQLGLPKKKKDSIFNKLFKKNK